MITLYLYYTSYIYILLLLLLLLLDDEDVVADAGNNADLYAANQASTELINEMPTE